jgi:hypothetical protein
VIGNIYTRKRNLSFSGIDSGERPKGEAILRKIDYMHEDEQMILVTESF